MTKACQAHMTAEKFGRIVNLSSSSAQGNRGQANYSAAKAGLQGFTKTLAIELGKFGVTANAVAPGFIQTEMTAATAERIGVPFDDFIKHSASQIPVQRVGQPEDIAATISFLCSEGAGFVSGQVIYVAGGPSTDEAWSFLVPSQPGHGGSPSHSVEGLLVVRRPLRPAPDRPCQVCRERRRGPSIWGQQTAPARAGFRTSPTTWCPFGHRSTGLSTTGICGSAMALPLPMKPSTWSAPSTSSSTVSPRPQHWLRWPACSGPAAVS